ncbi:MAG: rod shape-determining protein MreD [Clostridia bacterium]|nr:rod shape-determining protein MreD [Clostridia bacterium]
MKRKYYRYLLYAAEIFAFFIIEGTPGLIPEIYLAKPLLLVSAAVCAAAFELPVFSLVFGILCGLIIDVGTGGVMGLTSIILGTVCYYEASWNNKYIKNNIYFVLLYSAVCSAAVVSLKFFIFYYIKNYGGNMLFYTTHYIPRMLYTWAVTPLVYVVTMAVSKSFRKEKRKIKVKKRKRAAPSKRSAAGRRRAKHAIQ